MGRVSRYKKVKSCYANITNFGDWGLGNNGQRAKKRSLTVQKLKQRGKRPNDLPVEELHRLFDAPPDDPVDEFDLANLQVKKQKFDEGRLDTSLNLNAATSMLSNTLEEHSLLKKFEKDLGTKPKEKYVGKKQEGESKNAFRRRADREIQQIMHDTKTNHEASKTKLKTKQVLKNKKLKKMGREINIHAPVIKLPVEEALERRARATQVKFGEQAERPPVFHHLPRGAPNKNSKMKSSSDDAALEALRNKAQAQYALIKAKRKQNKESFHL
jgi:hypothetical protein